MNTTRHHLRSAFIAGLSGFDYINPFTRWSQMALAAKHRIEYLKGVEARVRVGLDKDWRRKLSAA